MFAGEIEICEGIADSDSDFEPQPGRGRRREEIRDPFSSVRGTTTCMPMTLALTLTLFMTPNRSKTHSLRL